MTNSTNSCILGLELYKMSLMIQMPLSELSLNISVAIFDKLALGDVTTLIKAANLGLDWVPIVPEGNMYNKSG